MQVDNGEFWFRSNLFAVVPGEDEAINPGIYGKTLAEWLAERLRERGYLGEIIEEDWGRCIMCVPDWLWVGCASVTDAGEIPKIEEIEWHCFVECELPFWKRLFGKREEERQRTKKLADDVAAILRGEPGIWIEKQ